MSDKSRARGGRRTALVVVLVAILVVTCAAAALWWWTRPRVLEAGQVVVLVEGRSLRTQDTAGTGMGVTLALIGDRCVGTGKGEDPRILVWPAGTSVSGSGEDVTIETGGRVLHLGDSVAGGTTQRTRYPELDDRLPEECRRFPLIQFAPD